MFGQQTLFSNCNIISNSLFHVIYYFVSQLLFVVIIKFLSFRQFLICIHIICLSSRSRHIGFRVLFIRCTRDIWHKCPYFPHDHRDSAFRARCCSSSLSLSVVTSVSPLRVKALFSFENLEYFLIPSDVSSDRNPLSCISSKISKHFAKQLQ